MCSCIYLTKAQEEEFKKYSIEGRKKQKDIVIPFCQRVAPKNNSDFYLSTEWRKIRYEALKIHGGRCMCCGRSHREHSVSLYVDHVIPRSINKSLELDINNLQVLCHECNLGKGNRDKFHWGNLTGTPKDIKGLLLQRKKYLLNQVKLLEDQIETL